MKLNEKFSSKATTFKSTDGQLTVHTVQSLEENEDGFYNTLAIVVGTPAEREEIDSKAILYRAEPAGIGFNLVDDEIGAVRFSSRNP